MKIYINKNNQEAGPFEEGQVLEMVEIGLYSPDDLAIRHGENQWQSLKVLLPHLFQTAPTNTVVSNNQQSFSRQSVVDWAKQNLQKSIEIELIRKSLFSKVLVIWWYSCLGIGILGLPIFLIVRSLFNFSGWDSVQYIYKPLAFGAILLFLAGAIFFLIIWLPIRKTRKIVRILDSKGLETRGGKRFGWETLDFVNFKKTLFAAVGNSSLKISFVFLDGTVFIPPLILNQKEVLGLLETIPIKRNQS